MEKRKSNIIFGKSGGNASRNSYNCKISIPKTWIDRMGVNIDNREVELAFDGDRISIERPKYSCIKHAPLASNKRIWCFAMIWAQMYKNYKTTPFSYFEDIEFLGEGLADLGFEMDCGKSFCEHFNKAMPDDINELKRILPEINIQILGNLIYSNWRWWNHWAMAPMQEEDFEWFVIAFSRLAELALEL